MRAGGGHAGHAGVRCRKKSNAYSRIVTAPPPLSCFFCRHSIATAITSTKPEDLPYAPDQPLPKLGGIFKDGFGFRAALADGDVRTIKKDTSEKTMRAAIMRTGKDGLGPEW